ncbi:MAG: 2-dehydro-3-deoxygalactonokinase [Pseudomonadota bacterium]
MSIPPDGQQDPVVGIDWGTTHRRVYLLNTDGDLIRLHSDEIGMLAAKGNFQNALADLLTLLQLERADVIMSGMVGSRNGWQEVPYLPVDHALSRLPEALVDIRTALPNVRCRIVPGYQFIDAHGTPDVMRGEETQVLGAMAMRSFNGWFLLPGTHSKWVRIDHGRIEQIVTFMTGELFALLSLHGTLAALMQQQESSPTAFHAGIAAAWHGSFTHTAFSCRSLVVTDMMSAAHASSYLSGLLIGTELQDIRQKTQNQNQESLQLIGAPALAARYVDALEFVGMSALVWQPDEVYVAALRVLAGLKNLKSRDTS